MIYIAGFILIFTGLQLLVATVNLLFRQSLARYGQHSYPMVSILIPARNEEKNIRNVLSDLEEQNYRNLEILVFDDQSTDGTIEVVKEFQNKDKRIKLIESKGLPEGWLGKNFACHSLSLVAGGEYFLFLDADVRMKGDIISQTVSFLNKHKLGLLSIFPTQTLKSFGEFLTVPNMNFILLTLLPLILVRKLKFSSLSAANGQFMLFHAESYKQINPHEVVKAEKVEDIKIARQFKQNNIKTACITGSENISCRMYKNYKEAVNGFSRNVIAFFGESTLLTIIFWLITTFGWLFVLFVLSNTIFTVYLGVLVLIRIFVSVASKQNSLRNVILMIPQQITLGVIITKSIVKRVNKQFEWKGRNIS